MNTWKDIVNFKSGFDCHMEPLHVKFCSQGTPGEPLADFGLGFVDGMARSVILHCAVLLMHDEAAVVRVLWFRVNLHMCFIVWRVCDRLYLWEAVRIGMVFEK